MYCVIGTSGKGFVLMHYKPLFDILNITRGRNQNESCSLYPFDTTDMLIEFILSLAVMFNKIIQSLYHYMLKKVVPVRIVLGCIMDTLTKITVMRWEYILLGPILILLWFKFRDSGGYFNVGRCLTSISSPIINIRPPHDRLMFIMGISILVNGAFVWHQLKCFLTAYDKKKLPILRADFLHIFIMNGP